MDLQTAFTNINWFSVFVAAASAFAIGSLWYSPLLFSKVWQKEAKLSSEDLESANMPLIFGTTFCLQVIAAIVLDILLGPTSNLANGISAGLLVSIAWIATSFGTSYLFSQKSLRLFLIDAGYYVVLYTVMGAILGIWN